MSLQGTFNPHVTLSSNYGDPFYQKSMNGMLNQSMISKKQRSFKTEAANFIKTSISNMIKDQLKAYRLQQKLDKELQNFKKVKEKKQFIAEIHRIEKFRQQQSINLVNRYENYIKQKERRDSITQQLVNKKKFQNQHKKQQNKRKIQFVRKRHELNQSQDIKTRISRAQSTQSIHPKKTHLRASSSERNLCSSNYRKAKIQEKLKEEQTSKISNYLKKIKHSQSRLLERQLKNQQRKSKSIKSEIKNLTKFRNTKEQEKMSLLQQKYQTKMESFYQNLSRSNLNNSNALMNRSMMKQRLRQRVIRNKELNQSRILNQTLNNFKRKNHDKENNHSEYEKNMDLLRSKSNFMSNVIKLQKQELEKENSKNIRVLYEKLQKLQKMKLNQAIPENQKDQLLSLIDTEDPFYPQLSEFLSHTKVQFLQKKIEKEEELAKAEKIKKTARLNKN